MIDHLKQMAIFARVVDEGSFRAAAKELSLSPSRISETVADLEDYLGVTLLTRTTRTHLSQLVRCASLSLHFWLRGRFLPLSRRLQSCIRMSPSLSPTQITAWVYWKTGLT